MATSTLEFRVIESWEQRPDHLEHQDVAAVATDSQGRVYLHTRNADRVIVYNPDGSFVSSWGDGVFGNAHGITARMTPSTAWTTATTACANSRRTAGCS